jgi:hypothetical protein
MVRDDERGVIGLEFGKKKYKLFFIRAESSHEPSRPQLKLGSFNYRARLARVILAQARAFLVQPYSQVTSTALSEFLYRKIAYPHKI